MRFASICSGIEAASVAWSPLGWDAAFFAEIERFPSEVLAARYGSNLPGEDLSRNAPPNLGDITRFQEWPDATFDLLVGGTPCQAFSVAGLRGGLADPRGNLALTYLGVADRYRPRWVVWENVPGVLSINGGRDFGSFLGGLAELGYGWAYRVLDAQHVRVDGYGRAVPQRRRRVFVVGHLGDWRRAGAVFLEPESLSGNSAPRREARKGAAGIVGGGPDGGRISGNVSSKWAKGTGGPAGDEAYNLIATREVAATLTRGAESAGKGGYAGRRQEDDDNLVAHSLRAEGFDASEDGTGRGTPLVPIAFTTEQEPKWSEGVSPTIKQPSPSGGGQPTCVQQGWAVRRLTPTECERLQGFPDGYTDILRAGGKASADGPRYKALGNSMAVNVMRWIGRRIQMVDAMDVVRPALEAAE